MQHATKECHYWTNNNGYIIFFFNILNLDQLQPCLCGPSIGEKIKGHKKRCRYYDYNIKNKHRNVGWHNKTIDINAIYHVIIQCPRI